MEVETRSFYERIRELLQTVPRKEWGLIAVVIVYSVLFVAYVTYVRVDFLKYTVSIGGVLLVAIIREMANKDWIVLRTIMLFVPVIAIPVIQIVDGREAAAIVQASLFKAQRERARAAEAGARELLWLDPRDTIDAIKSSDRGFLAKADWLAYRTNLRITRLSTEYPAIHKAISAPSEDPTRQLKVYSSLQRKAITSGDSQAAVLVGEIVSLLGQQISYRKAAELLKREIHPIYEGMLALNERSEKGDREFKIRLDDVAARVAKLAGQFDIAGLYNHAGMLAMASKQRERGLAYFLQAVSQDSEHLPAYESLAYAFWVVNLDSYNALKYSSTGLKVAARLAVEAERSSGASGGQRFRKYFDSMSIRLRLQNVYFSALQLENEKLTREYAGQFYKLDPADPEYQDTLGFVQMRFAKNREELEEAIELFKKAIENPKAERITKRLASVHLQQAGSMLSGLE